MENYLKLGRQAVVFRTYKYIILGVVLLIAFILFYLSITAILGKSNFLFLLMVVIYLLIIIPAGLYGALMIFLEYKNVGYRIQPNSLSLRKGILSVYTTTIPYAKITNISYDQTLLQRLFSVGTVRIDQEDSEYIWADIDQLTAQRIIQEVSAKSNIQPIATHKNKSSQF